MEIAIGIIILIFIIVLIQYNMLVKTKKRVEQEASTIDVYLTQRFDLIPNLVECVKAYTEHEEELLEKITKMRAQYMNTKDLEEGEKLDSECNKLIAYIENYPDLKASEQYLLLQKKLSKIESQLQAARRLYNSAVTTYNTKISLVPINIIAKIFKFKEAKLFEIDEPEVKENVNIKLDK